MMSTTTAMNAYVKIPRAISFSNIVEKDYTLSPSQYMDLVIPNQHCMPVSWFLKRPLQRQDLGVEVGSLSYITKSSHYFIRTKALQAHSFLPDISPETTLPILPSMFVQMNLKQGDLLISKDSNIGEIVVLDKDYPNCMLSGAIYRLPVMEEYRYYLLALVKHPIFREQLDYMVPKGATIRHAKTLFLDCKLPLPTSNEEQTIQFVSVLTQAIINKERLIKERHELILQTIEAELLNNQKPNTFTFELPRIQELETITRFDTGMYSSVFKKLEFLIKNYKHGFFFIDPAKIKSGNTPEIRFIGSLPRLKYRWVTPTHCNDYGVLTEERINLEGKNNINQDCILLINRTSKGGKGEFVGIAGFYKYKELGLGHHNQGMYQVWGYSQPQLLFLLCFLNCDLMRKFCSCMSAGSKMKELKIEQFLSIPFPNFPEDKQVAVAMLYHNPAIAYSTHTFTLTTFLEQDTQYNTTAGIYELDKTAKHLKTLLNQAIDNIVNDKPVTIAF
jgi:hypothetical protein